jgi:hypothetical protein
MGILHGFPRNAMALASVSPKYGGFIPPCYQNVLFSAAKNDGINEVSVHSV